MADYRQTRLWRNAFAGADDGHFKAGLQEAFARFRESAATLAAEIPQDLREYTVHDITHLDALWELADTIAGPNIVLNPIEAFVLGGAFLCHDLGMSAAAYVNGLIDIEAHALFRQGARFLCGCDSDGLGPDDRKRVRAWVLRENHAAEASQLPTREWRNPVTGTVHYLIESAELRLALGARIGALAASHWWSMDRVRTELNKVVGPPGGYPPAWTTDEFKLACLVRGCDAAHIDSRRAPSFLFAVRHLSGLSAAHWLFQSRLLSPVIQHDRLCYASTQSFTLAEADSWWACFDTITMIDQELRNIDSALSERADGLRLAARGVLGANDSAGLAKWVPVAGWIPVDARPGISDVAGLITKLGGRDLYGDVPYVPLRELLQNAVDAIAALRVERPLVAEHSRINVTLEIIDESYLLSVTDSGIGMSREVLLHALLDFGSSLWKSDLLRREYPRLAEHGLKTEGRYGIGFYSVFMWSDRVKVVTRRYDRGADDTYVLEFRHGLNARPVLRIAGPDEQRFSPGTTVQLQLKHPESTCEYADTKEGRNALSLRRAVSLVLPMPAVPVDIDDLGDVLTHRAVSWKDVDVSTFAEIVVNLHDPDKYAQGAAKKFAHNMRPVVSKGGEVLGRVALVPGDTFFRGPVALLVGEGGIALGEVHDLVGVISGTPISAVRNAARVVASEDMMAAWAREQFTLLRDMELDASEQRGLADSLRSLGADVGDFKIADSRDGWLNLSQIKEWARSRSFVIVGESTMVGFLGVEPIDFDPNVLVCPLGSARLRSALTRGVQTDRVHGRSRGELRSYSLEGLIVEALAEEWNIGPEFLERSAIYGILLADQNQVKIGRRRYSNNAAYTPNAVIMRRDPSTPLPDALIMRVEELF